MYGRVKAYIRDNHMIEAGETVVAGVSGGGDSMAMLSVLSRLRRELDFTLCAAHINHGIRGEAADKDQRLVESTCESLGILCRSYRFSVPQLAAEWKMGLEEAGRKVRRRVFEDEAERLRGEGRRVKIAVAHNQNDLAETMLHHLARGSGLKGLSSMRPLSGDVIRPLLCIERREIDDYLSENRIAYAQDDTNLEDAYTRNRIRRHILPLMEETVNPGAVAHMAETARILAQADTYLSGKGMDLAEAFRTGDGGYFLTEDFFAAEEILQSYGVMEMFRGLSGRSRDFTSLHVRRVLGLRTKQVGRREKLPYDLYAERRYQGVRIGLSAREPAREILREEWELAVPGELVCPLGTFRADIFPYKGQKIEEKKCTKWLDYDKINCKLYVRTRKTGDFLIINGKNEQKKLNRYMIDEKIPRDSRESIPLVACGSEVLWVVGGRISAGARVDRNTKRVLELTYQGGKGHE